MSAGAGREARDRPLPGAWTVVGVLWGIGLLNYVDRLMITTMRDAVKADVAMTDSQFGLLTSIFLWVYAAASPLGGFLADRLGRTRVIVGSLVIWSGLTWATGEMHSVPGLLLARGLMGISEGCYIPAALALIADYHRGSTRSLATGIHMSGIYAGAALGGIGGQIAEHAGWRSAFAWFGYIGIAYAAFAALILRDAPRARSGAADGERSSARPATAFGPALATLRREPAFRWLAVTFGLVSIANWGIYGWLPTYLRDHFQMSLGASGFTATGYVQVASFLGVLVGGAWADRWSRTQPAGRARVPAVGYLLAGPCVLLTIGSASLPLAVGGLIIYGLARGFYDANAMPIVRSVADERHSATGYGVLNFIGCVAGGVMVYIGGWMKDAGIGLESVFQGSAVLLLATGVILWFLRTQRRSAAP